MNVKLMISAAALMLMASSANAHDVEKKQTGAAPDDLAVEAIAARDWTTAEDQLRAFLQNDPDNSFAMLNLAYVLARTERSQEAITIYRTVLSLDDNPRAEDINGKARRAKTMAKRGLVALADIDQ